MSEELKAAAARMPTEVFNQGRLEVIDEVVHPDFVDHGTPWEGISNDREGLKAMVGAIRRAFPDLENTVNHVVAEGDLVAQHVTTRGTMLGELAGMPPTGKQATWDAMHLVRFRDGQIAEHWVVVDQLGMFQQLGFVQMSGQPQPA
ncbi:ester cyclase [Nocardioides panaciterrulae]|uniref:Putative ester cyclase n=1 Tax=Nocardioides panaciterrulae TaxID=661492 RepID=A0A7Y9J9M5_9ACTN|nr:ester cyclase [Nocardioides panaciterrulae]NYD40266.1 putative ester cyclase [Nocardioides panaciterrulae]